MSAEQATVLLVEDSPTQALQARHVLEDAGYGVCHVKSGEEAVVAARESPPQLIISDVVMPGMSGYELCVAIKSDDALKHIPFILLTALDTPTDVIHGLQVRADRYLIKSADLTALVEAVRELLAAGPVREESAKAMPFDVVVGGQPRRVSASPEQIVRLLLATYECAVRNNRDLQLAREALRRRDEELEEKVRERTRELSSANAELKEATRRLEEFDRARSEFITNVSHELRTPLASMSVAISNLLKGMLGPLPEKLQPYLTLFAQECERLKGTVANILDASRIDTQRLVLHRMKLPFHAWVRRAAGKLRAEAEARRVALTVTDREVLGFVDADPLKLERVMVSVLKNAVHYAPSEGHVDVGVTLVRGGAWIEMSVTDDGPGVPPEHLSRLTERYYRVGEFVSGTGLGLALCKEILECQGGEIQLLSPPPGRAGGTQALIRLPLVSAPLAMAVDDSRSVRMLLERQLTLRGYAVALCESPVQALERLAASKPDLLIVDSVMPGMDGADLIARVKADHALRHVPVLMITGAEVDGEKRKILEEFRIPVLGKPWEEPELIACVEDTIYGKHYLER